MRSRERTENQRLALRRRDLWGVAEASGAVAATATVAGLLGAWGWWLDLFAHFRAQYFAALVVLAVASAVGQRWKTAFIWLLFALVNAALIVPLFVSGVTSASSGTVWRALFINVSTGAGDPEKVLALIEREAPEFVVLAEIDSRWRQALSALEPEYPHQVVEYREDNFGIGLFSRRPVSNGAIVQIGEAGVPSVVGTVELPDGPAVTVAGTHPMPPVGRIRARYRNEQLARLSDFLNELSGPVLLLGDLNASPWSFPFRRLLRQTAALHDSARGFGLQPSWPAAAWPLRIPIDHCLHTEPIRMIDRRLGPKVGSDHLPLTVEFQVGASAPPPTVR